MITDHSQMKGILQQYSELFLMRENTSIRTRVNNTDLRKTYT